MLTGSNRNSPVNSKALFILVSVSAESLIKQSFKYYVRTIF